MFHILQYGTVPFVLTFKTMEISNYNMRAYCKNSQPHYRRFSEFSTIEDWLNAHHLDHRGLIEKGLANKASEEMYSLNK